VQRTVGDLVHFMHPTLQTNAKCTKISEKGQSALFWSSGSRNVVDHWWRMFRRCSRLIALLRLTAYSLQIRTSASRLACIATGSRPTTSRIEPKKRSALRPTLSQLPRSKTAQNRAAGAIAARRSPNLPRTPRRPSQTSETMRRFPQTQSNRAIKPVRVAPGSLPNPGAPVVQRRQDPAFRANVCLLPPGPVNESVAIKSSDVDLPFLAGSLFLPPRG
jgi:hypothetical protein